MGAVVFEYIAVGFDVDSTVKDGGFDFGDVLGEAFVFVCDLEGQFTCVTENEYGNLVFTFWEGGGVELVEGGEYEDSRFSHSGFGLAYDVHSEYGLGDAFVLDFGGVFESAVYNCTEAFRFEDEVFES